MPKAQLTHARIQANLLLTSMIGGAMGAPLIASIRETLQTQAGISRAQLGLWVFVLGTAGSAVALVLSVLQRRARRTTLFRAGLAVKAAAFVLLVVFEPAPGWVMAVIALAWLLISAATTLTATGNGMFADIWEHRPHTGVILMHAVNAFGKLLAPLIVLALGTYLRVNAMVYAAVLLAILIDAFAWPRASVMQLNEAEQRQAGASTVRVPRQLVVWLCAAQFAFIAGSEAGATAILGSLVLLRRPVPVEWIAPASWPAVVIACLLLGIVLGRVILTAASRRVEERAIITLCLICGLFSIPAALAPLAGVYLPALLLTGLCFSATWPAFFGLAARTFPGYRTFLSTAGSFANAVGISGCIYFASAIGNQPERLPLAFIASTAVMGVFALFLYATPYGRGLGAVPATVGTTEAQI